MCLPKEVKEREWSILEHDMRVMKIVVVDGGKMTSSGCADPILTYVPGVPVEVGENTDGLYTCKHDVVIRMIATISELKYTVIECHVPKGTKYKVWNTKPSVFWRKGLQFMNVTKLIPTGYKFSPIPQRL